MRIVEIIGYHRANLGKSDAKQLRREGNVPCVMYGGKEQKHFHVPMILFRDLVYTPQAAFVDVNVEGEVHRCILQDVQFHPVSEIILHADFLELNDDKTVTMSIPVKLVGNAPGVQEGGKLLTKVRKLKIKALPANMPENIEFDVSKLDLGKSVRVEDAQTGDFTILQNTLTTVASVEIPRALRGKDGEEEGEEGATEE